MSKQPTLKERLQSQLQVTQNLYNLWQQSQGAVTMLQELIKQEEDKCTDSETTDSGATDMVAEGSPVTPTTQS